MIEHEHFPHDTEAIIELGGQGARAALAPVVWSAQIGDRRTVPVVADLLHISRQAVYKRLKEGSLLGLPGNGTTWIPMWQIDPDTPAVRPMAGEDTQPVVKAAMHAAARVSA